jgi:hypothetical protein
MKRMNRLPSLDILRELFTYDPESGKIFWNVSRGNNRIKAGDEAGALTPIGYKQLGIDGKTYRASRIAYALYHGEDPYPYEIDHTNRDRADNRISNLRKVTVSENLKNKKARGVSGHKFISFDGRRKKRPYYLRINGVSFGTFSTLDEAIVMRDEVIRTRFDNTLTL